MEQSLCMEERLLQAKCWFCCLIEERKMKRFFLVGVKIDDKDRQERKSEA
jgi:hypothetical protein